MNLKFEQLKKDILFEHTQIGMVILKIKEVRNGTKEENKAALATYLMNFYNGIENMMKRCAKEYYKNMPKGEDWHKQLLKQSSMPKNSKPVLFNADTVDKLYKYLAFRHLFIHGYIFKLDWEKMKLLVDNIDDLWQEIKEQLTEFLKKI